MKRFTLSFIVLVVAIGIPLLFIHSSEKDVTNDERVTLVELNNALAFAIRTAENNYYKPVDKHAMYEGAIKGALAAIGDPYTFLLSERDHQRSVENLYNAEFGGLGVSIYTDHRGFVKISKPMPGTPAETAQLQAGDYITKVNGKQIYLGERTGMTIHDVVDLLRGAVDTDVTLTVQRKFLQPFEIKLTRAKISVPSVTSTMLEDKIGYIRITKFIGTDRAGGTEEEFNKALAAHKDAEMQALILDLRSNQGGLLDAAYHIADAFINSGVIVSTRGRNSEFNEAYPAHSNILCPPEIPIVVLVDEYSASASEIVAGAIKDTGRGILVGTKTYGKGVVQKRYPLTGIGAISLTISSYYTPNGTSIDKSGITPQVPVAEVEPNRIEQVMQRLVSERNAVENFVTNWIEEEIKRTGEIPKDFALLETGLPQFKQTLASEGLRVSLRWLTLRAEQLFNLNVGIERVVNLKYDTQLQEAIRIIKADEVGSTIQLYHTLDQTLKFLGEELQNLAHGHGQIN
ncbi:MAG: S41 family peptidase [Candidatus Poribacteria bacterium]|nr:S41 family peptidase [Candidatus Poribacteria bacterium]